MLIELYKKTKEYKSHLPAIRILSEAERLVQEGIEKHALAKYILKTIDNDEESVNNLLTEFKINHKLSDATINRLAGEAEVFFNRSNES